MGRIISDFQNTIPADDDFPSGRSKDNPGNNTGTPMNEYTMGDTQQFFAKLFREAGITSNGLPDGPYGVFQYYEAFNKLSKRYFSVQFLSSITTLDKSHTNSLLVFQSDGSGAINWDLPIFGEAKTGDFVEIFNDNSTYSQELTINAISSVFLPNNTTTLTLQPGGRVRFNYNGPTAFLEYWFVDSSSLSVNDTVTLSGAWLGTGGPVKVKLSSDNIVHFTGLPTNTSGSWATDTIQIADTRFFPTRTKIIGVTINDSGTYRIGTITVSTSGAITISTGVVSGTNVRFYLDGISYSID